MNLMRSLIVTVTALTTPLLAHGACPVDQPTLKRQTAKIFEKVGHLGSSIILIPNHSVDPSSKQYCWWAGQSALLAKQVDDIMNDLKEASNYALLKREIQKAKSDLTVTAGLISAYCKSPLTPYGADVEKWTQSFIAAANKLETASSSSDCSAIFEDAK